MSRFDDYVTGVDAVTGVSRSFARLSTVFGADSEDGESEAPQAPALAVRKPPSSVTEYLRSVRATSHDVPDGPGTVLGLAVGAGVGAVLPGRHYVLGAISGASLGRNVPAIFHASERRPALRNLASTGAGVAGALVASASGYQNMGRAIGYLIGAVAGGAAAYYGGLR